MGKYILIGFLIYLLYRALKRWMLIDIEVTRKGAFPKSKDQLDDFMVKDPFCGTFFPKREGVKGRINGEDLYFCSEKCRDDFFKQHTKK